MIALRPLRSGGVTKIWRSKRPGRSSAGSSLSIRLEAAITTTPSLALKPSSSTSSWLSVWSFSPEMSAPRVAPTASSSSMNTIAGAALRASRKSRRMRAAPSPTNISTKLAADCAKNVGAGLVGHGLGQQRLAGARRAVQQDPLRHLCAEPPEALRVAQELHDLAQLVLGLVGSGDVLPADGARGLRLDLLRLGAQWASAAASPAAERRSGP